eukprot:4162980-Amphidinium_carterae.1
MSAGPVVLRFLSVRLLRRNSRYKYISWANNSFRPGSIRLVESSHRKARQSCKRPIFGRTRTDLDKWSEHILEDP